MSRKKVRGSVVAWLGNGNVPGLHTVYRSQPKVDQPLTDYGLGDGGPNTGTGSGAYGVVHIADEKETRIAANTSSSGLKHITYLIGLVVHFKSIRPDAQDAMDDYDDLIDQIKAQIRAGRTLGQDPTVVWQAGEGQNDIHVASDLPKTLNGSVYIWSVLEFEVVEEIVS